MPTFCIASDHDRATPVGLLEALAAQIPKAQLAIIRGSGHLRGLERPKIYAKTIADFIETLP